MRRKGARAAHVGLTFAVAALLASCGRIGYDLSGEGPRHVASGADSSGFDASMNAGSTGSSNAGSSSGGAGAGGDAVVSGTGGRTAAPDASHGGRTNDAASGAGTSGAGAVPSLDASSPVKDASAEDASAEDASPSACAGSRVWSLDFDSDPALVDFDHDGVLDWAMRNASMFPVSELQNGVWHSASSVVLDTRPLDDFAGRTVVDVRMRSTSVPPSGQHGTVFWVNLNEGSAAFSALFVDLSLTASAGQTLTLFGKSSAGVEVSLETVSRLSADFVDIHLDIDPAALTVALSANGSLVGNYAIPQTGAPNSDHYATLLQWNGLSEFDSVRIERCPP